MQTLEIISVNLWQILISLCNLLILCLILKRFLYKPVKKVLAAREETLHEQYAKAEAAQADARQLKEQWETKMARAKDEADLVLQQATENAEKRSQAIVEEGRVTAERILRKAEADAALEHRKAESAIKKEIVDVSAALSEKMLEREITVEDHRNLIDRCLTELGEDNDGKQ